MDTDDRSDPAAAARAMALLEKCTRLEARADAENRDLTRSEARAMNRMLDEVETLAPATRTAEARRLGDALAGRGRSPYPAGTGVPKIGAWGMEPDGAPGDARGLGTRGVTDRRYMAMARAVGMPDPTMGGFESAGEFFDVVKNRLHHRAIRAATSTEGVGTDGGFLVPEQVVADLLDASLEAEVVRPRARVFPMASNLLRVVAPDWMDRSASLGGFEGSWTGEAGQATAQKIKLRTVEFKAKKVMSLAASSNEAAADGVGFEQQVTGAMQVALTYDLDEGFVRGTGAGMPLGVLNAPSTITVAAESGQSAGTIEWSNVVKMWARMHPACARNATWLCHPEAMPQLMTMRFTGSASDVPVFLPANAAGGAPFDTLMGRPLVLTEHASALGDVGDLILADLMQYGIGMRLDASLATSQHLGFDSDLTYWRLITRVDGAPLWDKAVTPRNGASTLSWAVVLEART
jgi:HK97 family phage major capsid protein